MDHENEGAGRSVLSKLFLYSDPDNPAMQGSAPVQEKTLNQRSGPFSFRIGGVS